MLPLALILGMGLFRQVHYRTHGFEWSGVKSASGLPFVVGTVGSWHGEDSAGVHIERNMAPYGVSVEFGPVPPGTVDVVDVSFVGKQSGTVVRPRFSAPEASADDSGRVVVWAAGVPLGREDYEVRLRVSSASGDGARDEHLVGTLRQTLEQRQANAFWEALVGI